MFEAFKQPANKTRPKVDNGYAGHWDHNFISHLLIFFYHTYNTKKSLPQREWYLSFGIAEKGLIKYWTN